MAAALSLYSRPRVVKTCIVALMERLEGRISQEELERRVEDRQLPLFKEVGDEFVYLQGKR